MLLTSSHRPPRSTLFPYTTLFRSEREPEVNRFIQKIENEVVRNRFINLSSLLQNVYHSLVRYLEDNGYIQIGPFDDILHPHSTMDGLDGEKIKNYIRLAKSRRGLHIN